MGAIDWKKEDGTKDENFWAVQCEDDGVEPEPEDKRSRGHASKIQSAHTPIKHIISLDTGGKKIDYVPKSKIRFCREGDDNCKGAIIDSEQYEIKIENTDYEIIYPDGEL